LPVFIVGVVYAPLSEDVLKPRAVGLAFWAVLGLAMAVRLAFLATVPTQPVTDFDWYFERGASIARGDGYAVEGVPTAYWPVGYPAALGAFFSVTGPSVVAGKSLNLALSLAVVALTFLLGRRLFDERAVAAVAAGIVAVHPAFVAYSGVLASEPLYTALTLAGLYALAAPERPRAAVGGALFGLATLVRPQAALLPFIGLLCRRASLERRVFWSSVAVVAVGLVLVLTPWLVRNQAVFGRLVFVSTNGGDNLLIGHHPGATGRYRNPVEIEPRLAGLDEGERDGSSRRLAVGHVRRDPGSVLRTAPAKLAETFLTGTDAAYWAFQTEKGRLATPGTGDDKALYKGFRGYGQAFAPALFCGAVAGSLLAVARKRRVPVVVWAMVGYTGLIAVAFFGNPRFGVPVAPLLALALAQGLTCLTAGSRSS
jgi:4-amino-4-deoxy-L-arabinose transferase-like glycosyltransferase